MSSRRQLKNYSKTEALFPWRAGNLAGVEHNRARMVRYENISVCNANHSGMKCGGKCKVDNQARLYVVIALNDGH